jgi:hypothetical protein
MIRVTRISVLCLICFILHAQTTTIQFVVNWPPAQLVAEKYGPLPSWAQFGEVIGCNSGTTTIHFGEGDVIATLRSTAGLQAFSRQDAFLLVSNSQSASTKNIITGYIRALAQSAIEAKAAGLIGGGNRTGTGIVVGAELVNILMPNLNGVLSLKQAIQYSADGLQAMMAIPAGRCTAPLSVLFAAPACPPAQAKCAVGSQPPLPAFRLEVPVDH